MMKMQLFLGQSYQQGIHSHNHPSISISTTQLAIQLLDGIVEKN